VDGATGDDANDGQSSGTALKTCDELAQRLWLNGPLTLTQDVTINIQNVGTVLSWHINVSSVPVQNQTLNFVLRVNFGYTSTDLGPITSYTPVVRSTKTRGQIAVASGTFVSKERLRLTSGTIAGAYAYSMGLAGDAQHTYISSFIPPTVADWHHPVAPSVGDHVAVDILNCTIRRFEINCEAGTRVMIDSGQFIRVTVNGSASDTISASAGGNVMFLGCAAVGTGSTWISNCGGATLMGCRVAPTSKTSFMGSGWLSSGSVAQGVWGVGSGDLTTYGHAVDGGNMVVGTDAYFRADGGAAIWHCNDDLFNTTAGGCEVENGPGPLGAGSAAINVFAMSLLQNGGYNCDMWGLTTGYQIGFQVYNQAAFSAVNDPFYDVLLRVMDIPSTTNMVVGGVAFPYSAYPILMPSAQASVTVAPYNGNYLENYVYKTAQSAAIGPTTLLSAPLAAKPSGLYRIRGYLTPTTIGSAGSLTLNAIFTDGTGVSQTVPICSLDNTQLKGKGDSLEIECNGTVAVQYSVTGYTSGLVYNVRVAIDRDSQGP
jgi:hypothetical protein